MSTATAWEAYLRQARWFGGKGLAASVTAIEPMPWYTAPGQWPAVRSEIARISYADGRIEHYQLLVAYLAPGSAPVGLPVGRTTLDGLGEVEFVDAPAYPPAMTSLIGALLNVPPTGMDWLDTAPSCAPRRIKRTGSTCSRTRKTASSSVMTARRST